MASLVPCTVCRRHVRRHETQCRFCGAERTPEVGTCAAGTCRAPRESLPRDVKRATLFALGLTLAGQACAEANDTPVYRATYFGGGSGGALPMAAEDAGSDAAADSGSDAGN